MAAGLNNAERQMVTFLEQRFQERAAWMDVQERAAVLLRLHVFYLSIGITRLQARQVEAVQTALDGGWRIVTLPPAVQALVEELFFS
ncbi:hypothetical protein AAVH_43527 [Aphelenchoides avenae]|nr:hypothetical protein AAVH_43527 [Aphelenchus avenae]